MNDVVTVVDYGMGNLFSVRRAFEQVGATVAIASTPAEVLAAHRLVLPGVGAFADGMAELRKRDLVESIRSHANAQKPFLGICLGMQMLMSGSEEFGAHEGLGIIPGQGVVIPPDTGAGHIRKIPHIGWNRIWSASGNADAHGVEKVFYFVHSFAVKPDNDDHCLAYCTYDGLKIAAVIGSGFTTGCQFHPEKSGKAGLLFLRDWLKQPAKTTAA